MVSKAEIAEAAKLLLRKMNAAAVSTDAEDNHGLADDALIAFIRAIGIPECAEAADLYDTLTKWYA
jgi:hypothetical protein